MVSFFNYFSWIFCFLPKTTIISLYPMWTSWDPLETVFVNINAPLYPFPLVVFPPLNPLPLSYFFSIRISYASLANHFGLIDKFFSSHWLIPWINLVAFLTCNVTFFSFCGIFLANIFSLSTTETPVFVCVPDLIPPVQLSDVPLPAEKLVIFLFSHPTF